MNAPTRGAFYVATGDTCRNEFSYALQRLNASNPSIPVTVFTDMPEKLAGVNAEVMRIDEPKFSFIDKIYGFIHAPYDINIYMDTDTAAAGDIRSLFALLDRFDLAASQGVGALGKRHNVRGDDALPESFAEFNTGVVCFRRNAQTIAAFKNWRALYQASPEQVHDQPSFRQAMYDAPLSLYVIPPEYNFLAGFAVLSGKVKIFHSPRLCTNPPAFDIFAREINQCDDVRLYVPPGKIYRIRR